MGRLKFYANGFTKLEPDSKKIAVKVYEEMPNYRWIDPSSLQAGEKIEWVEDQQYIVSVV